MRRRSRNEDPHPEDAVWLCDTLGELGLLYRLCPIVLLGNSFAEAAGRGGGHNPLEPARLGCALGTGPRMENFEADTQALSAIGGLAVLPDRAAMLNWLDRMLSQPEQRRAAADAAASVADQAKTLPDRLAARLLSMLPADAA
jgi:3-deoxy-D-manno-octulosonic-acid transferase